MPHRLGYQALRDAYRTRRLSPVEVIRSAIDHARRIEPILNPFALIDSDRALQWARASEQRWREDRPLGPLDGMPITVKEFAAVQGWPTRRGSTVTSADPAPHNAVFVQRLLDSGAVLFAKTRAPEFNWKGLTDSPGYGITRNPLDPRLTPGGSSGGCAAAVSAGIVRASLGSDAGGSVRIPAAFTGTIGLKPSFGRIPSTPLPSAFFNIVHTGPIAAGVAELIDVMRVVGGADPHDWTSQAQPPLELDRLPDPATLRIGLLDPSRWQDSQPVVRQGMSDAIRLLRDDGFELRTVDYPLEEASRAGTFFYRLGCLSVVRGMRDDALARMDPGLLGFVEPLRDASIDDLLAHQQRRDLLANELAVLFEQIDVLMLPTLPIVAFEAGRDTPEGWPTDDWMSWNPYTPAFNLAQMPALSYPVWPEGSALPVGVQFVAGRGREDRLLALAAWIEQRMPVRLAK